MNTSDIVSGQKRELEQRLAESYIVRDAGAPACQDDLIRVVLGPRRAGKSFFAMHALRSSEPFGYANFDDERLAGLADQDSLLAAIDSAYDSPKRLLLDEIQNLQRWELFVNRLQRRGLRLVVTGSNANLLSQELATHLTGRHLAVVLFPFSFGEYLRSLRAPLTETEQAEALNRYLRQGGFPEPIIKGISPGEYLATLFDSVLFKDIVKRFRIRAVQGLEDLAGYLASNIAREYSFNTLSRVTRCRSVHTAEKFLRHLEEAFLFFSLRRFSFKAAERAVSNKKVYCIDNGFVTAKGLRFSPDTGRLAENLVAVELRRRELSGACRAFYWRSDRQEEVDFVVTEGSAVSGLIQVCWDPASPKARDREIRALLKAGKELGCGNLLMLTGADEGEERAHWRDLHGAVRLLPLWKWLSRGA